MGMRQMLQKSSGSQGCSSNPYSKKHSNRESCKEGLSCMEERQILKTKRCRRCLVETGPHNVRHRTKLQYHICRKCEDMEDKDRRKKLKMHVLDHYGGKCVYVVGRQQWNF